MQKPYPKIDFWFSLKRVFSLLELICPLPNKDMAMFNIFKKHNGFAGVGSLLAFIVAAGGLYLTYEQLEQANGHKRWQNYNELNIRYAELYRNIPKDIASNEKCEFEQRPPSSKRWVRQ